MHNADTGEATVYDSTGYAVAVIRGIPANVRPVMQDDGTIVFRETQHTAVLDGATFGSSPLLGAVATLRVQDTMIQPLHRVFARNHGTQATEPLQPPKLNRRQRRANKHRKGTP